MPLWLFDSFGLKFVGDKGIVHVFVFLMLNDLLVHALVDKDLIDNAVVFTAM
jgi:hypothetical protein